MVFSSITFLIIFLPVVFLLYYTIPNIKLKNGLLLVASLLFYALGEPYYIILLLISCFFNYYIALKIAASKHRKTYLLCTIVFNLGMLCFFKYTNFLISLMNIFGCSFSYFGITLPIGISFYTFQILSYVIDVYRNPELVQKKFVNLMLYISFFPQLIAGPIVKYHDIDQQILSRTHTVDKVGEGLKRFVFGLSKKVLISNTLAIIVDQIYAFGYQDYNMFVTWVAAILYCLQIYYDFSGYSDMAIGLGKMFGFHFHENFMYPYSSTTIKEFWSRWHISLSSWFKEYLYIPLGGNRVSQRRTVINKIIVFFCTGLWHGANLTFVLWGLLNGFFASLEEKGNWAKKIKGTFIGWLYTSLVVILCFVLFRSNHLTQAYYFYLNMFTGFDIFNKSTILVLVNFNPYTILIIIIAIVGMFDWRNVVRKYHSLQYVQYGVSLLLLWLCMMSLASSQYNPFIYFRF